MALVTSFGMQAILSACLVSIIVILQAVGIPSKARLIEAVERLLDMARTPVNVFTNSCCASLVAANSQRERRQPSW